MKDVIDRVWDVIVIGTGMGGGTAGRALAEAGKSVLFIEKGRKGIRTERQGIDQSLTDPLARSVRGFWPDLMHGMVNGKPQSFFPALGSGAGGSSVFYAATLERPEPHDLDHTEAKPHPTGGWPGGYEAMQPWFDKAEALYKVHGEVDPLSKVPCPSLDKPFKPSEGDQAIFAGLRVNGRHPYQLHTAVTRVEGCLECLGVKCPRTCKMDGRSAGLEPALATGHAVLLDECEVTGFRGSANQISHVEATRHGQRLELRAREYVLAAGALNSPRLLLASKTAYWPNGCANTNDLVGRHLMFHLNEIFAIWPPKSAGSKLPSKSVGLRDLYMLDGQRMGMVQAMGVNVSYPLIAQFLKEQIEESAFRRFSLVAHFAAWPVSKILGTAKLFVGILEDLPYRENRVTLSEDNPTRMQFEYTIQPELMQRRRHFRQAIKKSFRGMQPVFGGWVPTLNYGHGCGTLRAGLDAQTSVLNGDCRAHEIENLYVADASFFPTSTGVNPSLTIAANALRVADRICKKP
jgi:choline dehydrogenase-like flavoprotein